MGKTNEAGISHRGISHGFTVCTVQMKSRATVETGGPAQVIGVGRVDRGNGVLAYFIADAPVELFHPPFVQFTPQNDQALKLVPISNSSDVRHDLDTLPDRACHPNPQPSVYLYPKSPRLYGKSANFAAVFFRDLRDRAPDGLPVVLLLTGREFVFE